MPRASPETTPSLVMGAASCDLPAIVVSGGPMLNGKFRGCDVGSGTSVCAVNNGQSVNIASGLTPQSGTMMSTRPGDYDAGAVNYMIRRAGISAEEGTNNPQAKKGFS